MSEAARERARGGPEGGRAARKLTFASPLACVLMQTIRFTGEISALGAWTFKMQQILDPQRTPSSTFSHQQIETFMDSLPFCVGYVNAQERFIAANRVAEEWFGTSRAMMQGRTVLEIFGSRRYAMVEAHVRSALAGEVTTFQMAMDLAGGEVIEAQSTYTPDLGADGEVRGFFFMGVDVTSRRRVEEELLRSQQVLEVITREQQRISHDLHDTVGQDLTGLSLMSKRLAQKLDAKGLEEAASAGTIAEGIKRAIAKVRKAIKGVAPVEIDAKGLMVALEHLALRTREQHSIDCHFECVRTVEVGDRNKATHLFRIAQEAVSNAIKHGEASRIVLSLEAGPKGVRLSVLNDGITIEDDADEEASGIGVRIMHFRAGVIGARLSIEGLPEGGTRVVCDLPREGE